MKKLIIASIALFSIAMEAQNITDAVRYSQTELNGTARFQSMSGAFGALGGDLSALTINPAGSAVFLSSTASLSLAVENRENEVSYMNGFHASTHSGVDLGQGGAAFVFNNKDQNSPWRKFTLGFNYNKSANYDNDFLAVGTNTRSVDQYFLEYANGVPLDLLIPLENESIADLYSYLGENEGFGAQQAMLGYQGFIIEALNPDDFSNTAYRSMLAPGSFDQEYSYAATGLNGKFSFNFATQYGENIYLGLNLNSHFLNYEKVTSLFETNNNSGSLTNDIFFEDRLSTLGSGFSFQLGTLARLGERFRAGLAYQSPVWYTISEESTQYLETFSVTDGEAIVNPNVVNIYPEYKLQTPSEYTGSLAYLFGSQGLISFDYSYTDYSTTKFKPTDDPAFSAQNALIESELKGASTYRIGGEYRISALSLRAGYRLEESPYVNSVAMGDLTGYSVGLGYKFGNISLDLAYETSQRDTNPQLFSTGLTDRAFVDRTDSNVILTVNFGI